MMDGSGAPLTVAHEDSDVSPAPGDLELVRSFLSMHDHMAGGGGSFPPGTETAAAWLAVKAPAGEPWSVPDERDLRWALEIHRALKSKVLENMGRPAEPSANAVLNEAAARAGLRPCFGCGEQGAIYAEGGGVTGLIGRILGAAFLAELDGSWRHLRECSAPDCVFVFYDHSKNHSAKWCSMGSCGNRNKARRFRERRGSAGED